MILFRLARFFFRLLILIAVLVVAAAVVVHLTNPAPSTASGWRTAAAMPDPRGEVASAVLDGKLVVVGGLHGISGTSDATSIYDIVNDRWTRGPRLPIGGRHHAAAAATGGYVYVSGGARSVRDWRPTRTVERFSRGAGWSRIADMPEGRQGHAMVATHHRLFVIGGVGPTDRVEIYNTKKKRWSFGASLPDGRNHLRAVVWNRMIWVIAGRDGTLTPRVDVYDTKKDEWTHGPPLPRPMSAMAVGVVGDAIHVVGGEDPKPVGGTVLKDHFVLRDPDGSWERSAAAPLAVHGAGYGAYKGRMIVCGGASRNGALSVLSWTDETQIYKP